MSWWRRFFSVFWQRPLRTLAMVISLGLIVGAAVSTMVLARSFNEQLKDIVTTFKVREQAYSILAFTNESSAVQRAFIASQDPAMLDLYNSRIAGFDEALDLLGELTKG
ncbi:MAG: CHASE3 domain-containing protein, partial [Phyllobacterium sp.]